MLTVHHLGVSQSERIVWLCEELAIPYELVNYTRDPVTRLAPAEYKALHPMGIAPVIYDGALALGESGAIIEYIIGKYGNGRFAIGPDSPDYADYLFWLHFANASMMATEMGNMFAHMLNVPADSPMLALVKDRTDRAYALLESRLGVAPYLAGQEFSAADIITFFPLTTMRYFSPRDLSGFPNILAYLKRVGERPAYQRAMAKGDPGMELLLS